MNTSRLLSAFALVALLASADAFAQQQCDGGASLVSIDGGSGNVAAACAPNLSGGMSVSAVEAALQGLVGCVVPLSAEAHRDIITADIQVQLDRATPRVLADYDTNAYNQDGDFVGVSQGYYNWGVNFECPPPPQCDFEAGERANVRTTDGIASFCLAGCQVQRTHSVGVDLGNGMETAHWYEHTGAACAADETPPYPEAMDATELNCATSASGKQVCLGDHNDGKNCGLVDGEEICADDPPGCGTVNGETVCPDDLPDADNCATSASGNRACVTDDGTLDDPENQADEDVTIQPTDDQGNPIPGKPVVHILDGDGSDDPPDDPCDPATEQCDGEPDPGDCDPETEECEGEGGGTFTGGSLSAKTFAKSGSDFVAAISESPLANAANGIAGLIPSGGGTCSPIGFAVWGHDISTDAHCQLLAQIATQLRLACLFAWCLTGIVVFMRA